MARRPIVVPAQGGTYPSVPQLAACTPFMARWWRWAPAFAGTTSMLLAATLAFAQPAATPPDATLDARVKALSSELRCLVCQNQTVADSDAPVARDMREQVRMQLAQGKSEAEVKTYMTDRFGDFVLYKPPLTPTTIALWLGPFAALLVAGALLLRRVRRSAAAPASVALTDADRERARALLNETPAASEPPSR